MTIYIADIINQLYQHTDGMKLSVAERDRLSIADSNFTYGEVNPITFPEILAEAEPKPGDIFYDLGSGAGKAVYCAAMLNDWRKCCGIELLAPLHEASVSLLPHFLDLMSKQSPQKTFHIDFIQQNILDVNWLDGDVIYLHATTFGYPLWDQIKAQLNNLKSGARIIVNTKQLDSELFEKRAERIHEMGWGDSMVFTYVKK